MSIDRNLWRGGLRKAYSPQWPCPSCARGHLRLKRDNLHYKQTNESKRIDSVERNIMDVAYVFSALLECDGCGEFIACCGTGGYEPVEAYDDEGRNLTDYELYFSPKYFSKPLMIFRPPLKCPSAVKKQLRKSFEVFFCDLGAAANHVRQSVEGVLTHAGIPLVDTRGKFIPLATRIRSFEKADPENAERANALRWIGNFGSHPEELTKNDLFDAYDIVDVLLEDLYVGHQRSVRQMVNQINRAEGPRR